MFAFGEPGFCPDCGSILPYLRESGDVSCFSCKKSFGPEVYSAAGATKYVVHFNSFNKKRALSSEPMEEGPVVERRCPKCGNDKMSYATLQLRSADEGQTVFYTCTKCKFKETENS
uniref:DNA-directed RNA polymerase subunit n=1 Tax=Lygus hesperus TaxID=30085 RepID=A0A0A9Z5P1_LYGHE